MPEQALRQPIIWPSGGELGYREGVLLEGRRGRCGAGNEEEHGIDCVSSAEAVKIRLGDA